MVLMAETVEMLLVGVLILAEAEAAEVEVAEVGVVICVFFILPL
jgi:hypothetical protein